MIAWSMDVQGMTVKATGREARALGVTEKTIRAYGTNVRYLEAGHGPPLVLIHGIGESASCWSANLEALAAHFHIYAPDVVGWGFIDNGDIFSIRHRPDEKILSGDGFHLAFIGRTREAIDAFYKAALANGGTDNGGSGLNPEYGPDYYAAFVFDPDCYRIEAVISPHYHH